ncbi:MAG: glycosyltransferase family 4 protein [Acidobacteria bacterium]|nr:glycosyltransferase family 4 protein [Acidobacteriota bacterium]MYK87781.1 glycosyltransferase family 4 protein [Acidobacteriota bacterium]
MHVLYVYPNFTTPRGAWSTRAYDFARRWIEQGHRVTVVTGVYDKSDLRPTGSTWTGVVDGIEVRAINVRLSNRHGLGRRVLTFLLLAAFASWHAVRRSYDVALVSSGPLTLGIAGLAARWLRRRPFVFEVRDLFSDGLEQLGIVTNPAAVTSLRWFEGACYRSATRVVALSETMAERIRRRHGIRGIAVVPNAASTALFDHGAEPPAEIAGRDAAFVFTGTMGRANDCGQLLQAARQLRARGRDDIHIYLVGDGQRRPALEAEALRDGLDHVHFVPLVPKDKLAGWLAAATAMVLTLKPVPVFDTVSPNKLFDAFAAGLPVIQTTQGWIRRVLADHDCGITVDATAPTALSDAMVRLADDRQQRDRMARNARRLASDVYSVDRLSNELLDTLVDALRPRRSTPAP